MIYNLHNEILSIAIASKGAELQSIINKQFGIEYMWSGDTKVWGKKSPVLFPIVGTLKSNQYQFEGKQYSLPRHGFARDMEFALTAQDENSLTLTLHSSEETLTKFPFHFSFSLQYAIQENVLSVTYIVSNDAGNKMFFSVGGHPAFAVPLVQDTEFNDYYLQFSEKETAGRYPLTADGLLETFTQPVLQTSNQLPLTKELFYQDALVFKHLQSKSISLLNIKTPHGLTMEIAGFPYLGLWSAKDADFVCIEPWCGIADSINATGKLEEKEGILSLLPGAKFERTWKLILF